MGSPLIKLVSTSLSLYAPINPRMKSMINFKKKKKKLLRELRHSGNIVLVVFFETKTRAQEQYYSGSVTHQDTDTLLE